MKFKYSICIITMNQLEKTKLCLISLLKTNFQHPTEIIIVDNNSDDGTVDYLMAFKEQSTDNQVNVSIVLNDCNRGCGGARNQGARMAVGEYLVIIDNDVEIQDGMWLETFRAYYEANPQIAILGPKHIYPSEEEIIQSAGVIISPKGRVGYLGRGKSKHDAKYNSIKEVQAVIAACWFMKREYLESVNGFDDIYYPVNYEDVDVCYKLRQKGLKVVYYPEVELIHHENSTTKNSKEFHFVRTTIKNGKVFKTRWEEVYAKENFEYENNDILWK